MEESQHIITLFIITTAIILLFLAFVFTLIFIYKKKQSKLIRDFEIFRINHEKIILKTELEIQEQTFKNISQEIHDNISLSLTLAKLNLNIISYDAREEFKKTLENSVDLISKSLKDLSDISKSLDSDLIKSHGLLHALEAEKSHINRSRLFEVNLCVMGEPLYLDSQVELILFRMVQESCNNIIKHSEGKRISITLKYLKNKLHLAVADDGKGFDLQKVNLNAEKKNGSGLNNLRNRAQIINANVELISRMGTGTTVNITLPFDKTK